MTHFLKKSIAFILAFSFLSIPCLATPNYTYITRVVDNYQTTQPQNNVYYDTHNTAPVQVAMNYAPNYAAPVNQTVVPTGYYNGYQQPVYYNGYAGYNTGYVQGAYYPVATNSSQPYSRDITVTQSYVDTRETVDKNISRAGAIATIVGGLALVGSIATAVIRR